MKKLLIFTILLTSCSLFPIENKTLGCVSSIKTSTPPMCVYYFNSDNQSVIDTCGIYNIGDRVFLTKTPQ